MPTPLTNDRWGFDSSCFVCEPSNPLGLRIGFQLDDDGETVSAEFTLGAEHSGAPTLVHGGVSLALLDEAQAWVCIAVAAEWGLTRHTESTFDGAVHVDRPHRVEARVAERRSDRIVTTGQILDAEGAVLVRSRTEFVSVGAVDADQHALGLRREHHHLLGERPEGDASTPST